MRAVNRRDVDSKSYLLYSGEWILTAVLCLVIVIVRCFVVKGGHEDPYLYTTQRIWPRFRGAWLDDCRLDLQVLGGLDTQHIAVGGCYGSPSPWSMKSLHPLANLYNISYAKLYRYQPTTNRSALLPLVDSQEGPFLCDLKNIFPRSSALPFDAMKTLEDQFPDRVSQLEFWGENQYFFMNLVYETMLRSAKQCPLDAVDRKAYERVAHGYLMLLLEMFGDVAHPIYRHVPTFPHPSSFLDTGEWQPKDTKELLDLATHAIYEYDSCLDQEDNEQCGILSQVIGSFEPSEDGLGVGMLAPTGNVEEYWPSASFVINNANGLLLTGYEESVLLTDTCVRSIQKGFSVTAPIDFGGKDLFDDPSDFLLISHFTFFGVNFVCCLVLLALFNSKRRLEQRLQKAKDALETELDDPFLRRTLEAKAQAYLPEEERESLIPNLERKVATWDSQRAVPRLMRTYLYRFRLAVLLAMLVCTLEYAVMALCDEILWNRYLETTALSLAMLTASYAVPVGDLGADQPGAVQIELSTSAQGSASAPPERNDNSDQEGKSSGVLT